jgi:DNA-binding TFAR19-related protein (PDSD5 family)
MSGDDDTQELRRAQLERELAERKMAGASYDPEEASQHERRAEKAEYLRRKLEERAESETPDG